MLKKMWLPLVNFRRCAASMRSRTMSALEHMITTAKQQGQSVTYHLKQLLKDQIATWFTFKMLKKQLCLWWESKL